MQHAFSKNNMDTTQVLLSKSLMGYCAGKLTKPKLHVATQNCFINAIDHILLGFTSITKPTWDVRRTQEKLVNHSPPACDLQPFLFLCGFMTPVNP